MIFHLSLRKAPFYSHVPAAIREEVLTYNAQESALGDAASLITSLLAHGGLCDRIKTDLLSLQKVLWGIKPTVSACWLAFPLTLIFFPLPPSLWLILARIEQGW